MRKVSQVKAYNKILKLLSHNFPTKEHQISEIQVLQEYLEKN